MEMPRLAPFFDFCVSGEDEDVFPNRKPHPRIFEAALARYREEHGGEEGASTWYHVGDCLANDIGASASCGAFAIWFCPDEDDRTSAASRVAGNLPSWSTATNADLSARASLAEKARERVSTRIQSLPELVDAIDLALSGRPLQTIEGGKNAR